MARHTASVKSASSSKLKLIDDAAAPRRPLVSHSDELFLLAHLSLSLLLSHSRLALSLSCLLLYISLFFFLPASFYLTLPVSIFTPCHVSPFSFISLFMSLSWIVSPLPFLILQYLHASLYAMFLLVFLFRLTVFASFQSLSGVSICFSLYLNSPSSLTLPPFPSFAYCYIPVFVSIPSFAAVSHFVSLPLASHFSVFPFFFLRLSNSFFLSSPPIHHTAASTTLSLSLSLLTS